MSQEPPYGPQGPSGPPPGWQSGGYSQQAKGIFGALFDYGFNSFVTPALVKVIYIVSTVLVAVYYLFLVGIGFASGPAFGALTLLLGWIPALLVLAFIRVSLEFYYAVIRMSEDVHHRQPGSGSGM